MTVGEHVRAVSESKIDWAEVRHRLERAGAAMREAVDPSPAHARQIMEQRARRLARPLQQGLATQDLVDHVSFQLANECYAIDCARVLEVFRLRAFTPVPGTPDHFVGVTNLRGTILPIVDLHRFFGLEHEGISDLSHIVVVGRERPDFGLLVDAVRAVEPIVVSDLVPVTAVGDGVERAFVRGVTRDAVIVLDAAGLLADERLVVDGHGPTGT